MPLPDALFDDVQTNVTTEETMTTAPTGIAFDPNGNPIGGIPLGLLDSESRLPAGILVRLRHSLVCAFRKPAANEQPVPVFEFENGCLLYVLTRVCYRMTESFFVHGTTEYFFGSSKVLAGETAMAVRVCPDRFDVMGTFDDVVSTAAKPPPLGTKPDDYVWLPPTTLPIGVDHAHFIPGPPNGVENGRLWNDEYIWHIVPPTRRRRCRILFRYRMARIRRWVNPDGTLAGPPVTTLLEPPHAFESAKDIPGCR